MRASLLRTLRTAASRRTPVARPVAATTTRSLASASAGNQLAAMTKENPHIDVVRYEHKNKKWSLNHCDYFSEAVAIGLLETGLQPGVTLLCWEEERSFSF